MLPLAVTIPTEMDTKIHPKGIKVTDEATAWVAFESWLWMFHGMTHKEEDKIKSYPDRNLETCDGLWRLPYERRRRWAVLRRHREEL